MREILIVVAVLVVLYAAAVGALWWYARRLGSSATLRDAARFLPDVLRLIRRLIASRSVGRGGRLALGGLALYLVLPIDVVPDVVPLVGWADDLVLVVLILRAVIRRSGAELLRTHWAGSAGGLALLLRLLRLGPRDEQLVPRT